MAAPRWNWSYEFQRKRIISFFCMNKYAIFLFEKKIRYKKFIFLNPKIDINIFTVHLVGTSMHLSASTNVPDFDSFKKYSSFRKNFDHNKLQFFNFKIDIKAEWKLVDDIVRMHFEERELIDFSISKHILNSD